MQLGLFCVHPPARRYSWWAYNAVTHAKDWLCCCCCDCGDILMGSTEDYEAYLEANV